MTPTKLKRLAGAGWTIGDAKDLLRLTADEVAMIEVKLQLANALRTARTRRRLTQQQLSRKLGSSQSRVAKMESGDSSVSLDLLMRSLFKLGATRVDIARHIASRKRRRAA